MYLADSPRTNPLLHTKRSNEKLRRLSSVNLHIDISSPQNSGGNSPKLPLETQQNTHQNSQNTRQDSMQNSPQIQMHQSQSQTPQNGRYIPSSQLSPHRGPQVPQQVIDEMRMKQQTQQAQLSSKSNNNSNHFHFNSHSEEEKSSFEHALEVRSLLLFVCGFRV